MKILITGVTGFSGRHLAEHLAREGIEVHGVSRGEGERLPKGVVHHRGDLDREKWLGALIRNVSPSEIYHLAGSSGTAGGISDFYASNVRPAISLFRAVVEERVSARMLLVSSSAVYAPSDRANPETDPMRPRSAYGLSKSWIELAARHYHAAWGLEVVVVRPFNLLGPGLQSHLFAAEVAEQIVRAEGGRGPPDPGRKSRSGKRLRRCPGRRGGLRSGTPGRARRRNL